MQRLTRQQLDERFRPVRANWGGRTVAWAMPDQPQPLGRYARGAWVVYGPAADGCWLTFPADLPAYLAAWSMLVHLTGLLPSGERSR